MAVEEQVGLRIHHLLLTAPPHLLIVHAEPLVAAQATRVVKEAFVDMLSADVVVGVVTMGMLVAMKILVAMELDVARATVWRFFLGQGVDVAVVVAAVDAVAVVDEDGKKIVGVVAGGWG